MKRVLELFADFSKCAHASGSAKEAKDFLIGFCAKNYAIAASDSAGNILAAIGKPKICLQSHYDMVSIGDHPPQITIENEWIKARNGTLGADNGIGVAAMLALIERGVEGEYLFTNDEEIGLLGANNLEVLPTAKYIINLDGENDSEIIVGCAGGVEYYLEKSIGSEDVDKADFLAFKIKAKNCAGGHSGVDIHRNIPSAIVKVCEFLQAHNAKIYSLKGGERMNSISKYAEAIAFLPNKKSGIDIKTAAKSKFFDHIEIEPIDADFTAIEESEKNIDLFCAAPHGVFEIDGDIVHESVNFAKIDANCDRVILTFFARADSGEGLAAIDRKIRGFAAHGGFEICEKNRYGAWKNSDPFLVDKIANLMRSIGQNPAINTIHAGLECGILKEKLPAAEIASIGMKIELPHSHSERVYIPSIEKFVLLLNAIMDDFNR